MPGKSSRLPLKIATNGSPSIELMASSVAIQLDETCIKKYIAVILCNSIPSYTNMEPVMI